MEKFIPLEEDDLELIGGEAKKKKLKRLKKKGDNEEVVDLKVEEGIILI